MLHQRGNILLAFPQRREGDRHNVQAIVQIFAKPAGADQLGQIFVGGSNQPDIHFLNLATADSEKFFVLDDSEQF